MSSRVELGGNCINYRWRKQEQPGCSVQSRSTLWNDDFCGGGGGNKGKNVSTTVKGVAGSVCCFEGSCKYFTWVVLCELMIALQAECPQRFTLTPGTVLLCLTPNNFSDTKIVALMSNWEVWWAGKNIHWLATGRCVVETSKLVLVKCWMTCITLLRHPQVI